MRTFYVNSLKISSKFGYEIDRMVGRVPFADCLWRKNDEKTIDQRQHKYEQLILNICRNRCTKICAANTKYSGKKNTSNLSSEK